MSKGLVTTFPPVKNLLFLSPGEPGQQCQIRKVRAQTSRWLRERERAHEGEVGREGDYAESKLLSWSSEPFLRGLWSLSETIVAFNCYNPGR